MGQVASNVQPEEALKSNQGLKSAFELFNEMSNQLAHSYDALQSRVHELNAELTSVSNQRLQELAHKEKLANRLETLLNVLPGGVIVIDASGLVSEANPAALEMLSEPLIGCSWRQVIDRNFSPRADDGHEISTLDGRRFSIATRSLDKDGQIILLTDQTQTRHLQQQLSRHERLSSMGKMVAALAHQIRTPLAAALLYCSHITQGQLSPERNQICANKVRNRLLHMERQVKDMLFFVKGELPLQDCVSVAAFAKHLAEALEGPLRDAGVNCRWVLKGAELMLQINQEALIGAVQNLVDNAIQADPEKGDISLVIEPFSGNQLVISVLDQGIGLPEAIAESVCDIFVTTKSQGTGIGLAVVQQVAKAHKGQFIIRSLRAKGTRASLLMPVIAATTSASKKVEL